MARIFRTLCGLLVVFGLVIELPLPAGADEAATATETFKITPIDAAKLAIKLKQYDTARQIIALILKRQPKNTDALFLMGESYSEQQKFGDAIPYYRAILVDHPELTRVRLDLARAEFETGDDEAADYNFRLAMSAQDIPDTVVDNIGRYLNAIRSRQKYTYSVNFSVAPDSDINAAAASRNIQLFGLPFELAENSVAKSGVGIVSTESGEYFTDIEPGLRIRTGGVLYSAFYPGYSQFDDIQARTTIGPQWLFEGGDVSVLGVVAKRWYGLDPYSEAAGGRLEGDYNLTKQLQLSSYLEGLSDSYHTQQYYNGFSLDQGNFLTYYLNPRTLVRLIGGLGYVSAETDPYEYWYWRAGFGVQFEFPFGITAYVEPDIQRSQYSGIDPFFDVRRSDKLMSGRILVLQAGLELDELQPGRERHLHRKYLQ